MLALCLYLRALLITILYALEHPHHPGLIVHATALVIR